MSKINKDEFIDRLTYDFAQNYLNAMKLENNHPDTLNSSETDENVIKLYKAVSIFRGKLEAHKDELKI